ncbi:hypothetical protein GW626_20280 [Peribacillus muralis]|uniref:hypothetical protein n=1 Tax=Peribacillus muralis TaxID=264697 RepID=UPI001F4E0DBE|nr:hypothetical protein [Peribacillus muralis]MCK1994219.1 hypothetical protein [Peribacillus muralis]MCK2014996.1 hypothetical protein [Peribacillus muralis]
MINYIAFSFTKTGTITTQQLHLFEHCFSIKITNLIERRFKDKGIIINAETFTESCIIEIYCSEIELLSPLIAAIESVRFDVMDLLMIEDEKKVVLQEVYNVDLTEEDKYLYLPLTYFSNEDILDLYEQRIETKSILILFNDLISQCNIAYFKNGVLRKEKNTNSVILPSFKSKWEIKNNYIIGCYSMGISSLKQLVLCKFISFIFGKSSDSLISREFLNPYHLYLGYTLDLSIKTSFYTLFLIETTQESRKNSWIIR